MRILLVDDSQDTTWVLSRLLTVKLGHEVRTVEDPTTAAAIAEEFRPDAVCVDISMPGLDGYELATAIRLISGLERIAIIAMSGYPSDATRAAAAGIDAHLLKPMFFSKVAQTLTEAVASRQLPIGQSC